MKLGDSMLQAALAPTDQPTAAKASGLPQPVRVRLTAIPVNATAGVERARAALASHLAGIEREFQAIQHRRQPPRVALAQLRALAGQVSDIVAPYLACAKGCSHCCYLHVSVTEAEAQLIGWEIRRKPRKVKKPTVGPTNYGYHMPCTFLDADGRCSIHQHRPLVCRLLLNVDVDELLCQLIPDALVPMPRYDTHDFQVVLAKLLFDDQVADIRDWFPTR